MKTGKKHYVDQQAGWDKAAALMSRGDGPAMMDWLAKLRPMKNPGPACVYGTLDSLRFGALAGDTIKSTVGMLKPCLDTGRGFYFEAGYRFNNNPRLQNVRAESLDDLIALYEVVLREARTWLGTLHCPHVRRTSRRKGSAVP